MQIIASLWWLWLLLFTASVGTGLVLKFYALRDTVRMASDGFGAFLKRDTNNMAVALANVIEGTQTSIFSRLGKILFVVVLGWVSGVLLLVSIVLNIAKMFTH